MYPWGGFEEDEPGEQYFQNLPTSSTASPAVSAVSSTGDTNLRQPPCSLGPPSPPSPSPSPHLSNTDALGEDERSIHGNEREKNVQILKQDISGLTLSDVLIFFRGSRGRVDKIAKVTIPP